MTAPLLERAAAMAGAAGVWSAAEACDGIGKADALTASSKKARREKMAETDTILPLCAWKRFSRKNGSIFFRPANRGHSDKRKQDNDEVVAL